MNYIDCLSAGFGSHVAVREKRPGVMKLLVPLYHEDGDMVDIFLEEKGDDIIRVSDRGLSLMRLSYHYDIDTDNKEKIFRQILNENNVKEEGGNLFIDVNCRNLYPAVLHLGQVIGKVCSMSLYRREVIANLFYEMLDEVVMGGMADFRPVPALRPIPSREELEVDYGFNFGRVPVFLFGAKGGDTSKIRLITIACLEFQKYGISFRSAVVHQSFDQIPKRDTKIITSAVDKQFVSLDDFKEHGAETMNRLAA